MMKPFASPSDQPRALEGIRVLDLSRVLAGPWASQILGDLGAEILKIERPGEGDDTRHWGPPFLDSSTDALDAAYFSCCNRNKEALAIDIAKSEGADLVRKLAAKSDIVLENFRVGQLAKYGLDYDTLKAENPDLIYCSITGFGQSGPYSARGGYDFLIQGMSGLMSVTGYANETGDSGPLKAGIPVSDLFTGLYAAIAILAALNHRNRSGEGQNIDCSLLDTQLAVMANQASNYMVGGQIPRPLGNEHPNVVPYRDFATGDGRLLIAIVNDRQFQKFCGVLGCPELALDERFSTNGDRLANRGALEQALAVRIATWRSEDLLAVLEEHKLPAGPVNTIAQILADPHVKARGLQTTLHRDDGTEVPILGFPAILGRTPASYKSAPPRLGQDTRSVISRVLGLDVEQLDALQQSGVIACEAGA